jgi:2-dehydropantoate 2-reductase
MRSRRGSARPRVLGGRCAIGATLDEHREIVHLNGVHSIVFGELEGHLSARVGAILEQLSGARFDARSSTRILLEMWEKWVFLATLASSTCLFRAPVVDIAAAPGGSDFVKGVLEECRSIASAEGYAPRDEFMHATRETLASEDPQLAASMFRDIENHGRVEADHVIGDLLERARARRLSAGGLALAYTHLKTYEARRRRTNARLTNVGSVS